MDRVLSEVSVVRTPGGRTASMDWKAVGKHFTLGDKAVRHLTKWAIYTPTIIVVYKRFSFGGTERVEKHAFFLFSLSLHAALWSH